MAVYITTKPGTTGAQLLARIKADIQNNTVRTWAFNAATGFVHVAASGQWNTGAYLEVQSSSDPQKTVLYLKILPNTPVQLGTYGVLNGRFAEMLLNHYKDAVEYVSLKDLR